MTTNGSLNPALLAQVLGTSVAMTGEQLAAVADEVVNDPVGRGYAGKSPAEVLELLNVPYTIANPTPQGMIDREYCAPDEFALVAANVSNRILAMPSPPAGLVLTLQVAVPPLLALKAIRLTNPDVSSKLATLHEAGLITDEEMDTLTKTPDPSYQATLERTARAVVLFGGGATIELSDLVAAGV